MKTSQICKTILPHFGTWRVTHFLNNTLNNFIIYMSVLKERVAFARKRWGYFCPKLVYFRLEKGEGLVFQSRDDFIPFNQLSLFLSMWSFTTYLQHSPLDDHHIKRTFLIKTLLVKNFMGKTIKEKKKYKHSYNLSYSWSIRTVSLKTLSVKANGIKLKQKEKRVQYTNILL